MAITNPSRQFGYFVEYTPSALSPGQNGQWALVTASDPTTGAPTQLTWINNIPYNGCWSGSASSPVYDAELAQNNSWRPLNLVSAISVGGE
jgi:hypothetical protein